MTSRFKTAFLCLLGAYVLATAVLVTRGMILHGGDFAPAPIGASTPAPPPGDAGTVLTSTGPSTPATWQNPFPGAGFPTAPEGGLFLESNGPPDAGDGGVTWGQVNYTSLGSPWVTALDLDLTAQGSQTFTTNGNYTFGGLTWTKGNSADETAHASLSSSGLNFQPSAGSAYPGSVGGTGPGSRTLPYLWTPLSAIVPASFDWDSGIRVWIYVSADNLAAEGYGASVQAIDDNGSSVLNGYAVLRGYDSTAWTAAAVGTWSVINSSNYSASRAVAPSLTLGTSNKVAVLEIMRMGDFQTRGMFGSSASLWPATTALSISSTFSAPVTTGVSLIDDLPSVYGLLLGAQANGSGGAASVTISRVRVDYKLY